MNLMTLGQSIKVIPSFFYLTYIQNDGAALNILSGDTFILITISLIALLYIIKLVITSKDNSMFQTIIYSLLISGILGNVIDRIFYGKVIDFLDFHIFSYNFPVFNFADAFIVIGAILLVINIIRSEKHEN